MLHCNYIIYMLLTGSSTQKPPPASSADADEVQSTPKKKCKSPTETSSPRSVELSCPRVTCPASQETNQLTSPQSSKHPGCSSGDISSFPTQSPQNIFPSSAHSPTVISPIRSPRSAVESLFTTPEKETAVDSDDQHLFDDDRDLEFDQSLTQKPNPSSNPIDCSPKTPSKSSHKQSSYSRDVRSKRGQVSSSPYLLVAEENTFVEEEVSRLYRVQDENSANSLNTSTLSKLDRLLEKSYKSVTINHKPNTLDDNLANLLNDLGNSPATVLEGGRPHDAFPDVHTIYSAPRHIPIM